MTVNTATSTASYTGNGTTQVFSVPFYFLVDTDLKVSKKSAATGVTSVLTLNSDYTLSGAGNNAGGSMTALAAPASGDQIYIERNVSAVQQTSYPFNAPFPSSSHEKALDRLTMLVQQQGASVLRTLMRDVLSTAYNAGGNTITGLAAGVGSTDAATVAQVAAAATAAAPFVQALTGATTRTVQDKLADFVNLKDFGAKGDGVTDDTLAINRALATGKTISITQGTYKTTGGHQFTTSGQGFIGDGVGPATFIVQNASTAFLTVVAGLSRIQLSGFIVDRAVTATSGGNGIVFQGNVNEAHLENLVVTNQYIGIILNATQQSMVRFVTVNKCQSHGIFMQNNATVSQLQWFFETVAVGTCAGDGFRADTSAGLATCLFDTWHNCFTFANSGCGINLIGTAVSPIADVRISDGFFGADGTDEIRISNTGAGTGGDTVISNCFFESAGGSNTGPTFSTPPTNAASCISLDASNTRIRIVGNRIGTAASFGITSAAATILISGNIIHDNNLAGLTPNAGVQILAGKATIVGNIIGNSITSSQKIGVACAADNFHVIVGNDLSNNATSPLFFPAAFVNSVVQGNAAEIVQAWTPTLTFGGASVGMTYTTRVGNFVKYGKKIVATFQITLSAKGSSTGVVVIGGLPIAATAANSPAGNASITFYSAMASLTGSPVGNIQASGFGASLFQNGAANSANLTDANFTNTTAIQGVITYLTN